jgi:hydrogenase nickel incorporation protein HypA/HybF
MPVTRRSLVGEYPRSHPAGMHELSIALELVEVAVAEAQRLGDVRIVALHLRVGPLAGIVPDALRFSFDVAAAGTAIEGARLEIEQDEVTAWCATCAEARALASMQHRRCPVCDDATPDLLGGDGLELTALEIADRASSDC